MPVFSATSDDRSLRSNTAFRITVLNPSIPYSANSHWISTDASSSTAIRETSILERSNSAFIKAIALLQEGVNWKVRINASEHNGLRFVGVNGNAPFRQPFLKDLEVAINDVDQIRWRIKGNEFEDQSCMPYSVERLLDIQENTSRDHPPAESMNDLVIHPEQMECGDVFSESMLEVRNNVVFVTKGFPARVLIESSQIFFRSN
ncbi:hypothetical protein TNCV_1957321 [Trichonephila clavipes]|nr:hypothetical protein TNCV_1957321 [Trichonephila clavipes]